VAKTGQVSPTEGRGISYRYYVITPDSPVACRGSLYGELRGWLEMAHTAKQAECPFIVSWKGPGISEVKTAWNKTRQRARLSHLLIHDLRRTAVRNMIRAGIPEKQAMRISGHKTRSMFDRYDITDERDIQSRRRTSPKWTGGPSLLSDLRTSLQIEFELSGTASRRGTWQRVLPSPPAVLRPCRQHPRQRGLDQADLSRITVVPGQPHALQR